MYDTDEEQIEAMKKWWLQNGNMLIVAILVSALGYFGFSYYKSSMLESKESASASYQQLLNIATVPTSDLDTEAVARQIDLIRADHGKSVYAVYAALFGAKFAVESDDLELAASYLNWALENNDNAELDKMVRMRLARVETARGNHSAGLRLIADDAGKFVSGFAEIRGDILMEQGNVDQARQAYELALEAAPDADRPVLQMKLNDLAI